MWNKQAKSTPEPEALHELLELAAEFRHFLYLAQKTTPKEESWTELLEKGARFRGHLRTATYLAEEALGGGELISSLKILVYIAEIIKTWPAHPKRKVILKVFETYTIDESIRNLIDRALSEHSGNLIGLLNLDLRAELVVMLEVQVEQLATQLRALEKCETEAEKMDVLRTLDPLANLSKEQLEVGVLSNGVISVNDFELTVSAVAVFALLRPDVYSGRSLRR